MECVTEPTHPYITAGRGARRALPASCRVRFETDSASSQDTQSKQMIPRGDLISEVSYNSNNT